MKLLHRAKVITFRQGQHKIDVVFAHRKNISYDETKENYASFCFSMADEVLNWSVCGESKNCCVMGYLLLNVGT